MEFHTIVRNLHHNAGTFRDALRTRNVRLLLGLMGPAYRGLILQRAKSASQIALPVTNTARFNWDYSRDKPELARLYSVAKRSQWNAEDLDWSIDVDPFDDERALMPEQYSPIRDLRVYRGLSRKEQQLQRHAITSWMLSQFLHGEQGALFAACEVTEAVEWTDGKLYGSTQVVDEGRHVEVFHRYLSEKLNKVYDINDNLYVLIDALMSDNRWDMKFLGMQIMIEGLALGAFSTMRGWTREPLLRDLLKNVITDEARHVHYGVVALSDYYSQVLTDKERREREDWAFEVALLMRNRFLAHEFYDEYYGHMMTRRQWDRLILGSESMSMFRQTMFRRIIPNLKRIGLLTDRMRPHYAAIGLLLYENDKAAPDLTARELLAVA